MNYLEKTAYLRGLADGMKLEEKGTDESKMLMAVIAAMEEMAQAVSSQALELSNLSDDLEELDDVVTGLEEQMDALDDDDEEEEADGEDVEYQLDCPQCGQPVVLDEDTIDRGETECPHCGAHLSIDLDVE